MDVEANDIGVEDMEADIMKWKNFTSGITVASSDMSVSTLEGATENIMKWKNFISGITVEWLLENEILSINRKFDTDGGQCKISTYSDYLTIDHDFVFYKFHIPDHMKYTTLGLADDDCLREMLSMETFGEFIRIRQL